jgi:hypothetical protein
VSRVGGKEEDAAVGVTLGEEEGRGGGAGGFADASFAGEEEEAG